MITHDLVVVMVVVPLVVLLLMVVVLVLFHLNRIRDYYQRRQPEMPTKQHPLDGGIIVDGTPQRRMQHYHHNIHHGTQMLHQSPWHAQLMGKHQPSVDWYEFYKSGYLQGLNGAYPWDKMWSYPVPMAAGDPRMLKATRLPEISMTDDGYDREEDAPSVTEYSQSGYSESTEVDGYHDVDLRMGPDSDNRYRR